MKKKTKNNFVIYLREKTIIVYNKITGGEVGKQTFSDSLKAEVAFNLL